MKTYEQIAEWCKGKRLRTVTTEDGFAEERRRRALGIAKPKPVAVAETSADILKWARESAARRLARQQAAEAAAA
jgi:hypothetical protein